MFIYVSKLAASNPGVVEFVRFYLENADELVQDVGYIPLPATEYVSELEEFNAFISKET